MGYNCVIQVFSKTSVVRNVSCDESLGGDRRREGGREGKGKEGHRWWVVRQKQKQEGN